MLDQKKTMDYYLQVMHFIIKPEGQIDFDEIPLISFYACPRCKTEYSFDTKEYEKRVRMTIADLALRIKKSDMLASLNPHNIDPDNGLEYCGICDGYDKEGNCLSDMVKRCPLRKLHNEKLSPVR